MDSQLRDTLLANGVVSGVSVNQRHLIDKILARYSAEYTIYRELAQNSNDAGASKVRIEFKCAPLPPDAKPGSLPTHCTSITYKNNGVPFREEDWHRITSIAEGNPGETTGFFGVGAYSLFSVCEEPFITSGDYCLGFFWRGDQLFSKHAAVPDSVTAEERKWTSFLINLRETMEVPRINDFSRFLAACLSFTENLMSIDVLFDDHHVIAISKTVSPEFPLDVPGHTNRKSPQSLFTLRDVEMRNVQMTAKVLQEVEEKEEEGLASKVAFWFGVAKPKPPKQREYKWVACSIFLRVARAAVNVHATEQLQMQMERTTKKRVPAVVRLNLVYNTADEYKISQELAADSSVFADLVPFPDQGNVFIGFRTHQTTGCSVHLAGHFIPTVERENMDFVDPTLAHWNRELLSMGGALCRVLFDNEVSPGARISPDQYTHLVNVFACRQSTPAATVSQLVSRAFFLSSQREVCVLSTAGVRLVSEVRMFDEPVAAFLAPDALPMLANDVYTAAKPFFDLLLEAKMLRRIAVADVFQALPDMFVDEDKMVAVLQWATANRGSLAHHHLATLRSKLPYARWAAQRWFPPSVAFPTDVLPLAISKKFDDSTLRWLGFTEFTVADWAAHVRDTPNLLPTPEAWADALGVFARAMPNLPANQAAVVLSILGEMECLPTTQGMQKPRDAYVSSELFGDLPVVSVKVSDKFLKQLGVRDHIDPQLLMARLDTLQWTPAQLLQYLSREKLDDVDIAKLAKSKIFSARRRGAIVPDAKYAASELLVPAPELDAFDVLQLDTPETHPIRAGSREHRFLVRLGIQQKLDLPYVIQTAADPATDAELRFKLLEYAAAQKMELRGTSAAILPPAGKGTPLAPPAALFTEEAASILGFTLLHPRLVPVAEALGVVEKPPVRDLLAQLQRVPLTAATAKAALEYLASRAGEFGSRDVAALAAMAFIPTPAGPLRAPHQVYLKPFPLLDHVDYGETANTFLRLCGVKDEPSPVEMAEWLLSGAGPAVYGDKPTEYLEILTKIAFQVSALRPHRDLLRRLAAARVLVGFRGAEQMLVDAQNVFLVDDPVLQNVFTPVTCPMDPVLETFYETLGARWLNSVIHRRFEVEGQRTANAPRAAALQARIRERAPLLVYDLNNSGGPNFVPNALDVLNAVRVEEVAAIHLVRSFAPTKQQHTQAVSACMAERQTLLVSAATAVGEDVDYFDVARSLSWIIFKRARLNDQLLLSTLLSTPLEALRQKGFPVDRILKITLKQKRTVASASVASTPPASPAGAAAASTSRASPSPAPAAATASPAIAPAAAPALPSMTPEKQQHQPSLPPKNGTPGSTETLPPSYDDATGPARVPATPPTQQQLPRAGSSGSTGSVNASPMLPGKFNSSRRGSTRGSLSGIASALGFSSSSSSSKSNGAPSSPLAGPQVMGPSPSTPPPPGTTMLREGTPEFEAQLRRTLDAAIRSTGGASPAPAAITSPPQLAQAQATFCDVVSGGHDLVEVSEVTYLPLKLYRGRGHAAGEFASDAMRTRLVEFVGVLLQIADVFGLPRGSVHVYYDEAATSVAFNRARALFFNAARYSPSRNRGGAVATAGQLSSAVYTYWYMVFAHELGHNHVGPHNADHEFYMSSYAHQYMTKFMIVLLGLGIDLAA
ncbi:hypothetical protein H9P43_002241 [Blastocladiella emersonii ATCC 22665]|nr:hypothetical protein H9P43_002241 [Blastocladiella emersonii ATCC 22665]